MYVQVYDRDKINRSFQPAINAAVLRVLSSDFTLEPEINAFEQEFAAWNDAAYAITVNSGTAAIVASLLAVGVERGDEVITVPNTDGATSSAIRMSGAQLVWVDIDPVSRTMSVEALEAAITSRTRAIVPVDMFGHPAEIDRINEIARSKGIPVVEDACLALGATTKGRKIGSLSTVTCFSFGRNKHLGAIGSGGCVTTEDGGLAERLRMLSGYGEKRSRARMKAAPGDAAQFLHETIGLNQRLEEVQAAILRVKLPSLAANIAGRREQAFRYEEALKELPIVTPQCAPDIEHAWRNYVIEVDKRDEVRQQLHERGVGTNLCFTPPMHLQQAFADIKGKRGDYPVTEAIANRLIGLPLGPHMTSIEQEFVIENVRASVKA